MKKEKQKGITLIALVITIVVLLILAGVVISQFTGPDNIIDKSKDAKSQYEQSERNEEKALNELEALIPTIPPPSDTEDQEWVLTASYSRSSVSKTYEVYKKNNNTEVKIIEYDSSGVKTREWSPTLEQGENIEVYTPDGLEYSAMKIEANGMLWWAVDGSSSTWTGETKDGQYLLINAPVFSTSEEAANAFGGGDDPTLCGLCSKR